MRTNWWGLGLGLLLTGTTAAQPPVKLGPPIDLGTGNGDPLPMPARMQLPALPTPVPPPPPPPAEFGVGIPVSPPVRPPSPVYGPAFPEVRPPAPVSTAPIEEPPGPRFWVGMEYLLMRTRGDDLPPLFAVTDPRGDGAPAIAIVSPGEVNQGPHNGVRLSAGYWLSMPQLWGVETSYWWLSQDTDASFSAAPPGTILSRPFVDPRINGGEPRLFQISTANGVTAALGQVQSTFDSDGFELNALRRANPFFGNEMHWIIGARYWGLREDLSISALSRAPTLDFESVMFDRFATENRFFGAQVGSRIVFDYGRLNVVFSARTALGVMYQEANIDGTSALVSAAGTEVRPGGFLALRGNIGEHERTKFAMLGDLSLRLYYRVTEQVSFGLGYNLLLVSNVLRPGGQIDPVVNPALLPFSGASAGPVRPTFEFVGKQFWMHGINVGLTVRF